MGELGELLDTALTRAISERDTYKEALERIEKLGAVCDDFKTCHHRACLDSSTARLLASSSLRLVRARVPR